jgi:hypothetical protein
MIDNIANMLENMTTVEP